jgi:hypothetical protein
LERAAETGSDRVDEDEIAEVQPRARIVDERDRIRGAVAFAAERKMLGPIAPKFRYTDEAPGPPLNAKVTGRSAPSITYEVKTTSPVFFEPSAEYTGIVPTVAVYFNVRPPSCIV